MILILILLSFLLVTLNKQYIITSIDTDSNFQLVYIDIVTYLTLKRDTKQ